MTRSHSTMRGFSALPQLFGKTAVAAWLIASRKVNTLILVHRQQLLDQWHARLAMFLGLPAKSIGQIGGGVAKRSGCVDIAILQSAHDKEGVKDFVAEYGQVIAGSPEGLPALEPASKRRAISCRPSLAGPSLLLRNRAGGLQLYVQCVACRGWDRDSKNRHAIC